MQAQVLRYFFILWATLCGALGTVIFLTGCSTSPQVTYYALHSSLDRSSDNATVHQTRRPLAIGIGPVKFPDELDRSSIVTRSGQSRLVIDEFHRWGGSLEKNFLQILADNLAKTLQTDQVMIRPWERYFQPDIRVTLNVYQFDGRLGESATLKVTWALIAADQEKKKIIHRSSFTEPLIEDGYEALVSTQSRLVAQLSREIAQGIEKL